MRSFLTLLLVCSILSVRAQRPPLTAEQKASLVFPAIKGFEEVGVLPVKDADFTIDPKRKYNVLLDVTVWSADSLAAMKIHPGLAEVGRQYNLHLYAGVPERNVNMVAVFHGPALRAILNNEAYKRATKREVNPNASLVDQLQKAGIKLIACGQALNRRGFEKKDLLPGVLLSVSAKTTSSYFQSLGYAVFLVNEE